MSAIIKSETISRRKALSLMGLAAAFGLAAAPTVLTVSDAEAQTAAAPTAAAQPLRLRPLALSGVRCGAQRARSGVRCGAQRAQSGVRCGAQVQLPAQVQVQLPAQLPGRNSNCTGSAKSLDGGGLIGEPPNSGVQCADNRCRLVAHRVISLTSGIWSPSGRELILIMTGISEFCRSKAAMEVIRGRERDCRQEIRGQARRGGTRSTGELIRKGKRSAQLLTKARILLKADVSDAGEGWSDSRIAAALDTSIATVERTRRQLVEEGFEAVLARKYNSNSARPRIFDGVAEAKLIALTLSPAPEGFARWSLRLLEEKVVELNIVVKTSDNTIGRTLKKTFSNRTSSSNG